MSTGEDEPLPGINGRLRPRKSTNTPSPQNKTTRNAEDKITQERPKRSSTPPRASPSNQDDLATKFETSSAPLFLCPYCDRKFNARLTASKHARRIHLSTTKQDNFIKCLYCNHSDAESNAIIKHMVDSHPNQYFACLDCHTRFPSTTELAEHKLNVCEKQKPTYRKKLRQKTSAGTKKNPKRLNEDEKLNSPNENSQYTADRAFSGIVISCELKPSEAHDEIDIEDEITTNLILPPSKALGNAGFEKNAVIVLDDLQWNKRIPPNFSFHNTDADQILSRLGVVHRSPRVGESKKDLIRMMDEPNEKFEKCFDTSFYSRVAKNVQENLAKCLDGTFNFNPDKDNAVKTRKSKTSVVINTAEGFPILLAYEQFSRSLFDGFVPRAMAPKHKWKWDTAENDNKNLVMLLDQTKSDSHANSCIITLVSSLDIWTQLRMKHKFEEIYKMTPTAKKTEQQNIISLELKEILESRDIPTTSTEVVQYQRKPVVVREGSELPSYLGLSPNAASGELQPAVLSGEWVRPRCYVCCACGEQTRDARALSTHIISEHPNAQVQHYEIVGETLLSADILKHLYVPPSQMSNRTRPPRGFRDCTKCKKSITLEDMHQHMLDCAGDTPAVRRKCRYRPFGVRRRRPRLPDNTIRKKMRKDIRSRHRQKGRMRPRPKIRTEVGDAETIRKMIADLPAKRNRITPSNVLRPRRNILKSVKLRALEGTKSNKARAARNLVKSKKTEIAKKENDTDNASTADEDDQPLKLSATRVLTRNSKQIKTTTSISKMKKVRRAKESVRKDPNTAAAYIPYPPYLAHHSQYMGHPTQYVTHPQYMTHPDAPNPNLFHVRPMINTGPGIVRPLMYPPYPAYLPNSSGLDYDHVIPIAQTEYNKQILQVQQQLDIHGAGPSNIRHHSNHGDYHMQNRADFPMERGYSNNRNNNMAQAPNMPLKHSIASLTSGTEPRDATVPLQHSYFLPPEISITPVHEAPDDRGDEFKKDAAVEEVDKPPLPNKPIDFIQPDRHMPLSNNPMGSQGPGKLDNDSKNSEKHCRQMSATTNDPNESISPGGVTPLQNDSVESGKPGSQPPSFNDAVETQKPFDMQSLPKDLKEFEGPEHLPKKVIGSYGNRPLDRREPEKLGGQTTSKNDSIEPKNTGPPLPNEPKKLPDLDGQPSLLNESIQSKKLDHKLFMSNDPTAPAELDVQKPLLDDTAESTEPGEEQKDIDLKMEIDKSKLSKTRKGLSYYIAMLRTKKGLRLDQSFDDDDETNDSELIDPETIDTDIVSAESFASEPLLTETENKTGLTPGRFPENKVNLTPAQVFSRSALSEQYKSEGYPETSTRRGSSDQLTLAQQTDTGYIVQKKASVDSEFALLKNATDGSTRARSSSHTDLEIATLMSGYLQTERSSWIEPYQRHLRDNSHENMLRNMQRNSYEDVPVPRDAERNFDSSLIRVVSELCTLSDPVIVKSMIKTQARLIGCTEEKLKIHMYYYRQHKLQSEINRCLSTETAAHIAHNKLVDSKIISRQSSSSPTSRRTVHQPVKKNSSMDQNQPGFSYHRSTPQKNNPNAYSPSPDDFYRNLGTTAEDFNTHLATGRSLPAASATIKSPPAPRPGRYKRVLDIAEINAAALASHDSGSQNKILKKSLEIQAKNTTDEQNRHLLELTRAQSETVNYDSLMKQAYYHEQYANHYLNMMSTNRGFPHLQTPSEDFIKRSHEDMERYKTTNEFLNFASISALISMSQGTHGTTPLKPETESTGLQDTQTKIIEKIKNAQLMSAQNQIFNKNKSKADYLMKESESAKTNQESKANVQTPNLLDGMSQSLAISRNSFEPHTSSSSSKNYASFDDNKGIHDSSQGFHKSQLASLASAAYPKNICSSIPPTSSLPIDPNADELIPLDLSCDPKVRKEPLFNSSKSSDVPPTRVANLMDSEESSMNFPRDYTEQPRSLPGHPSMSGYKRNKYGSHGEFVHIPSTNMLLEKSENNRMSKNQEDHEPPNLIESPFLTSNTGERSQEISINNQKDITPKQSPNLQPSEDLLNAQKKEEAINRQERMHEKTFIENKKIVRSSSKQVASETKFKDKTLTTDTNLLINLPEVDNQNVGNDNTHTNYVNTGQHINIPTNTNDIDHQEPEVVPENKNINEQDLETARKIAMLPKELAKILDTIPKDHLDQLLNVLPQYVSTPVSMADNEMKNIPSGSVIYKNSTMLQMEKKQNISCDDSNRLSVNTAISPSSIIPKKRHSPSHPTVMINSNETTLRASLTPTLAQHSPMRPDINLVNKEEWSENESSLKKKITDSFGLDQSSEENESEINVDDLSDPENMNKNEDVIISPENSFYPPLPIQDLKSIPLPKPKNSNGQTASLRAVRIKTTSERKSISEEKKIPPNYCYQTKKNDDEKYTSHGQPINPVHYSYSNLMDFEQEITSHQMKLEHNSDMTSSRASITISQNPTLEDDKAMESSIAQVVRNENEHFVLSQRDCSVASLNRIFSHEAYQDPNQSNRTVSLDPTAVDVQGVNKEQDHFLGQIKSTAFTGSGNNTDLINVQKNNLVTSCKQNEMKELLNTTTVSSQSSYIIDNGRNDFNTEQKLSKLEELEKTNEDEKISVKKVLPSDSLEQQDFQKLNHIEDKALQDEISDSIIQNTDPSFLSEYTCQSETLSPKHENFDSDDEISLAVIKLKHDSQPIMKEDSSSARNTKKQSKMTKVKQKRRKKKLLRNRELNQNNKPTEVVIKSNNVEPYNELSFNDNEVYSDQNKIISNTFYVNTTIINDDKLNNKIDEFDVNKENNVTDTQNKVKDDDYDLWPEHKTKCLLNMNVSTDANLHSEAESATEKIKKIPAVEVADHFEIGDIHGSDEGSASITNKNITSVTDKQSIVILNTKSELEYENTSDVDGKMELKLNTTETLSINVSSLKPDDSDHDTQPETSLKNSTTVTLAGPGEGIDSDFQICSDIRKGNTLTLRRSRRGKSMYLDSTDLGDSEHDEQVEDIGQKTHLTMKRLILSRVEKDKKRIKERIISEKDSDTDDVNLTDSEVTDLPIAKKGKTVKRKKSPHLRRKSKKTKPISLSQHEEESSDVNNAQNSSEKSSILRELQNAEIIIEGKETRKEEVKCHADTENASSLSENSTVDDKEQINEVPKDTLIDVKETNVPGKRKLNISKITDLVSSKSKKTKYPKNKSKSDFDSDDDKGLLETKLKIATEQHSIVDKDSNINKANLEKEKSEDTPSKGCDEAYNDSHKQIVDASITVETRMTCYNRPVSNRRSRSSSISFKDQANYDPYNIDFEDMIEITKTITKRKGKHGGNNHVRKRYPDKKPNIKSENLKFTDINISSLRIPKQGTENIVSNDNYESDSDSSKSDVPLQKYVDDKALQIKIKLKNIKDTINTIDNAQKKEPKTLKQKVDSVVQTHDNSVTNDQSEENSTTRQVHTHTETSIANSDTEIPRSAGKGKKHPKRVNKDGGVRETVNQDQRLIVATHDKISTDQQSLKQQNKEKKTSRTISTNNNVDSMIVSNEVEQQLRSDKFMENFGFYSERIPRKSNLLASKKISETFHMISNESDDSYFGYKEKSSKKSAQNENKKKSETSEVSTSQDSRVVTSNETNFMEKSTLPGIDAVETIVNESSNAMNDTGSLNSSTAHKVSESEEIQIPKNNLIAELKSVTESVGAQNYYENDQRTTNTLDTNAHNCDPNDVIITNDKKDDNLETVKKINKSKPNKQASVKDKMYPDIEEIDMLEDKFDKIKRKRRSQAVAAKQAVEQQHAVETNTSVKSRKQSEKKRTAKNSKKNGSSPQILTKGALKGFDGIKISIPTQDLNMPPNVSTPKQLKKRKKVTTKRRKDTSDSESSCSESDEKEKSSLEKDIYEFKDSEDAELLELRPSTVMDRFRSMHNKKKQKHKEKDRDKQKERNKDKEKESGKNEGEKVKAQEKPKVLENQKRHKILLREEGRCSEKAIQIENTNIEQNLDLDEDCKKLHENKNLKSTLQSATVHDSYMKIQKNPVVELTRNRDITHTKGEADSAVAGTSGFVPKQIDESDYESVPSSPEGEFIFYVADDMNCVCSSDNDSEESDVERGCKRPNCVHKHRNADKNAAIGNIFKNNAVRCEKTDIMEPENPRPDMDQLFDSLFETNPSKSVRSENQNEVARDKNEWTHALGPSTTVDHEISIRTIKSPVAHHDHQIAFKHGDDQETLNKGSISHFNESFNKTKGDDTTSTKNKASSKNIRISQISSTKCSDISSRSLNEIMSDSDSIQFFTVDDKPKEKLGFSLVAEECTQVYPADITNEEMVTNKEANEKKTANTKEMKVAFDKLSKYHSEDEFDVDKPEPLNRQYMHLILPADKVSSCAQTEDTSDHSDGDYCYDSVATKYLKGLPPAEAASLEVYTMVSAQGTQTEDVSTIHETNSRSKSEDEMENMGIPKNRIRLHKVEITNKTTTSKGVQTDKNYFSKYDAQNEIEDDNARDKHNISTLNKFDSFKGNTKSYNGSKSLVARVFSEERAMSPPRDSFATPVSRSPAEKYSPRKSDEGISTSHDYSADAFDLTSFDNTGVACQRARRKCTVGKQNVLAEHWSSESEFDVPRRPNSADSVVAGAGRKKKSRKKEHHSGGRKGRHASKNEKGIRRRAASGERSDDSDACAGPSRAPPGPKIRARPAPHYWSSDGEEAPEPPPQHGWIVGDSHKKLVTMLAHAKGRKRNNGDKRPFLD